MLPQELQRTLETGEFEDEGWLRIIGINLSDDGVKLNLLVNSGLDDGEPQNWLIWCRQVRDYEFKFELCYDIELLEKHILLWPYMQNQFDLFFSGHVENSHAFIGELYEKHHEITKGWLSIEKFINDNVRLNKLITGGHGKLARGPQSLIEEYEKLLIKNGLKASTTGPYPPQYWDGQHWLEQSELLYALVIGNSFVVAETFEFSKGS
jgi:hypothetical protein